MKTRSLYDHEHHAFFPKGGHSFVLGSLSMPDHWFLESSVLFPFKQCVSDIQDTGLTFTDFMTKL